MRHFSKNHTTVREIACWSIFLAKLSGANGSSWPSPGHPSSNPQAQNSYNTQVASAGRKKSTPIWLGATQEIVFIELGSSTRTTLREKTTRQLRARRHGGGYYILYIINYILYIIYYILYIIYYILHII